MSTSPLILASTSRYRAELLSRLEVPFEQAAPTFDERTLDHELPRLGVRKFAVRLAEMKARSLATAHPGRWILAADQLAVVSEDPPEVLHKPGTPARAVETLMRLRGRTHQLVTGVILLRAGDDHYLEELDVHRLTMRDFSEQEARAYVASHAPVDCAGSYRIEDAGIKLFASIEGQDFTGIIGLPLLATARLLRRAELLD